MCELWRVVAIFFQVYTLVLIAFAVLSWLPDVRGPWVDALGRLVQPVLDPIRRIIPPLGGIDWSFLVLIILIQILQRQIIAPQLYMCLA
jgi:YggT family protein